MISEITTHYCHVRQTDTEGRVTLREVLVWSTKDIKGSANFIAARQRECNNANAEAKLGKKPAKAKVEQITEDQFKKERK